MQAPRSRRQNIFSIKIFKGAGCFVISHTINGRRGALIYIMCMNGLTTNIQRHLAVVITAVAALCATAFLSGCSAKLSEANEQFERGEYFDAQKTYRKVYNKLTKREERGQRGQVAYQMGLCYDKLGMSARASSAFANALRYGYPDSTATLLMAKALHEEGKYAQAQKAYEEYLEKDPTNAIALNGVAGCNFALAQKGNPTRYVVKNAKLFNSRRADFAPMFADPAQADVLYFTTTNEKALGNRKSEITGM